MGTLFTIALIAGAVYLAYRFFKKADTAPSDDNTGE